VVLGAAGLLVLCVVVAYLGAPTTQHRAPSVPFQDVNVIAKPSYERDIQPIFDEFCVTCHGELDAHNGLQLDSYEEVMKGTQYGPVVIPGDAELSNLRALIEHETDPSIWMPFHGEQVSPHRIENIINWIRNGAAHN
jgi:hypothetical protein